MIISNKEINIYIKDSNNTEKLPVVILNNFDKQLKEIIKECDKLKIKDFIAVEITRINWNKEMSPWPIEKIFKNEEDYTGEADKYLEELENKIIPKIENILEKNNKKVEYYIISGYSLAGLFALYTGYKTKKFKKIITVSGSMWYLNFEEYIRKNKINSNINSIYFSLGNLEKLSENPILKTVEEKTKSIEKYLSNFIKTKYEENEGNHFKNVAERISKGIKWSLEN